MNAVADHLVKWLAIIERAAISGLMATIVILTLAQVFWRYVLQLPLQWSEEVARYCFVWVTFLGAAALMRQRDGHPAIDALVISFGTGIRRVVGVVSRLMVILGSLAIAIGGFRMVQLQWHQLSPSLEIPMVWIYASMFFSPLVGIFWTLWCARYGWMEDEK